MYNMLQDRMSFQEINNMPLKHLYHLIKYYTPKLKEMAKRREQEQLKAQIEGKKFQPAGQKHVLDMVRQRQQRR